ncbi:MAG: glutamine-hydrolyzing carbamoyl-phosphate synthase small subunit [Deferribacterota bacterium]|nr:glutamine-hydrolyzing carbamoyl-phosphate synthase small subunit [Deferribacterota bacterium]
MKKAILVLEDGEYFLGNSFGSQKDTIGEIVFNTSITGYQEILTDPSYYGQIVVLTNPHIGNYGINDIDRESDRIYLSGFVVKEYSKIYSNHRALKSLDEYLKEYNISAIENIDTRKLVRHIRDNGSMNAIISANNFDVDYLVKKCKEFRHIKGVDLVSEIIDDKYEQTNYFNSKKDGKYNIVLINLGAKYSIIRYLETENCNVINVSPKISYEKIVSLKPDAVLFSNGPGDPEPVCYAIDLARKLMGKYPLFGICLGCQILALAIGCKTYKLKFGHHGGNHPVKDLNKSKIYITAQNHCFAIDKDSIGSDIEITHLNLNDNTIEGIKHKRFPLYAVQFHPEGGPGPHDCNAIFKEFIGML